MKADVARQTMTTRRPEIHSYQGFRKKIFRPEKLCRIFREHISIRPPRDGKQEPRAGPAI
jgi:hypothetical protein